MSLFWKTTAGIIIALILVLTVEKQEKDIALLLTITVCIMASATAFSFFEPVLDFLYQLESMVNTQSDILKSLLKMTGIGIISEIVGTICQDSGHSSIAKGMQFLATAVILNLSLPVFEHLMDLIQRILGGL